MNAFTRGSRGSQSCVPSSEQESCTMCSSSTPCLVGHGRDAQLEPRGIAEAWRDDGKLHVGRDCLAGISIEAQIVHNQNCQTFVRNFCATGIRRPMPNARGDTFKPGAACRRLYSLKLILFTTSLTTAASKPRADDFRLAQIFHDIQIQNRVQNFIRRQRILVRLVGPQLRARRLGDGIGGNDFALAVDPARDFVNVRLQHVRDAAPSAPFMSP